MSRKNQQLKLKKLPEIDTKKDDDAWQSEIADVKPFINIEERPQKPLVIDEITSKLSDEGLYNHNSFKELKIGEVADIDGNLAQKFISGNMKIEARLDLHGLREKQAFTKVVEFIKTSYSLKRRCVLIITGKGEKSDEWWETKGVIKQSFPQWLNNTDIRPYLLGVAQAKQSDGGGGAFYCLLKRQRAK